MKVRKLLRMHLLIIDCFVFALKPADKRIQKQTEYKSNSQS